LSLRPGDRLSDSDNPQAATELEPEATIASSDWTSRKQVRVAGAAYAVRRSPAGDLEVCIDGIWRAQSLFRVVDDESLQAVVEIMLIRHGKK
jgi:hypothetical protein